jgi:WD40 repeat protein
MKNIISLVLVLVVFSGCLAAKNESQSGVQPAINASEGNEIAVDSVIFTRTGVAITTNEAISAAAITISGNGTALKQNIGNTANSFVLDLQWIPDTRYNIEIASKEGDVSYITYSPSRASPLLISEVKLEDITPENISQGWSNVKGSVKFSPDGKFIALGSDEGFVRIFDSLGSKIWEKEITGNISDVAFSPDSGRLFVGERSSNAYVYSFDVKSGEELWKYRTADDIGTDVKYQPAVYRIKVTDNSIYASASRYWKN